MENKAVSEVPSEEYLGLIWQKEIELNQKLEQAKREGKKIVANAQIQAEKMIQKAKGALVALHKDKKEEIERKSKQEMVMELKQEISIPKELGKKEREELEKLEKKAAGNMNKAVALILEKVVA